MPIPTKIQNSPAFQYAQGVLAGAIVTGKRIRQAVERFYRWIDECEGFLVPTDTGGYDFFRNEGAAGNGFYLDHEAGMHIIWFASACINHTTGKLQGRPFELALFQAFTMYNVFAWKKMAGNVPNRKNDVRRIKTVYDKRAKKNGKSAEMAMLALYMMSFDEESEAQVYVGATKEDQARICWKQAKSFIDSHQANPVLKKMGFYTQQRIIGFHRTGSTMMPLGGDSKTQDGINAHLAIIDEYHAHKDDSVKENLESSMVMRAQPIIWHITTAGTNVQSACKRYEDSVIEILEGRVEVDHILIMIHDMDEGDDWENEVNWYKANPLLGQGMDIESLRKRYAEAKLQPSKIPEFKTKSLNMWVDAPTVWIPSEIWANNKRSLTRDEVIAKFRKYGGYLGVDMSINTDLTAVVAVSEPDDEGNRFVIPYIFCPLDTIDKRSREDKVPYRYWADNGHMIATPGNQVDFDIVEDTILHVYRLLNITRVEADRYQFEQMAQNLINQGVNVSYMSQSIVALSAPTKAFERLVYNGNLLHDGNPVLAWNLAGCLIVADANENIKVHKGKSNANGRRIDGIPALINALAGSLSPPEETNESVYNNPNNEIFI